MDLYFLPHFNYPHNLHSDYIPQFREPVAVQRTPVIFLRTPIPHPSSKLLAADHHQKLPWPKSISLLTLVLQRIRNSLVNLTPHGQSSTLFLLRFVTNFSFQSRIPVRYHPLHIFHHILAVQLYQLITPLLDSSLRRDFLFV